MGKWVQFEVDTGTWADAELVPYEQLNITRGIYPKRYRSEVEISIFKCMQWIGYLTTPTNSPVPTINSMWAQLRYFGAFTGNRWLTLRRAFSELDPHQKTILSDDMGMGATISHLDNAFNFLDIVDGRYFVENFGLMMQDPEALMPSTRGQNKCPDFVALDKNGKIHVIECKGTQSGNGYLNRALRDGKSQKQMIAIDKAYAGQSLVAGISIVAENADLSPPNAHSVIKIVDPNEERIDALKIKANEIQKAEANIARGAISKALNFSGLETLATLVSTTKESLSEEKQSEYIERIRRTETYAAEFSYSRNAGVGGRSENDSLKSRNFDKEIRLQSSDFVAIKKRYDQALYEIRSEGIQQNEVDFDESSERYIGYERIIDFPPNFKVGDQIAKRARVKVGFNARLTSELESSFRASDSENLDQELEKELLKRDSGFKFSSDERSSTMVISDLVRSHIDFE